MWCMDHKARKPYAALPLCQEPGCTEKVYRSGRLWCMNHKASRRPAGEMTEIRQALYLFAEEFRPIGVRQAFYSMVAQGLVPKDQAGVRTVERLLILMRRDGSLPYFWIEDSTRWMHKPRSHDSIEEAVNDAAESYRRALWTEADSYVEVWVENRGLISTLYPVTSEWDVPLMPAAGFSSMSFLYATAMTIKEQDRPCFIYYLGDSDKAGKDAFAYAEWEMSSHLVDDLDSPLGVFRYFFADRIGGIEATDTNEVTFEWLAVTDQQIKEWDLPTRPPKDRDRKAGITQVVELDAIPPDRLRELVRDALESHIPATALEAEHEQEEQERATFSEFMAGWAA